MVNVMEQVYHLLYRVFTLESHILLDKSMHLSCLVDDVTLVTFLFQSILTPLLVLVINVCLSCVSFFVKAFHAGNMAWKSTFLIRRTEPTGNYAIYGACQ